MTFKSTNRGAVPLILARDQVAVYQPRSGSMNTSRESRNRISTAERLHEFSEDQFSGRYIFLIIKQNIIQRIPEFLHQLLV